jgi:hypothetical protein
LEHRGTKPHGTNLATFSWYEYEKRRTKSLWCPFLRPARSSQEALHLGPWPQRTTQITIPLAPGLQNFLNTEEITMKTRTYRLTTAEFQRAIETAKTDTARQALLTDCQVRDGEVVIRRYTEMEER